MTFGKRLAASMAHAHFDENRLAAVLGHINGDSSLNLVSDWLEDRAQPNEGQLRTLSVFLRTDGDWLLTGSFRKDLSLDAASGESSDEEYGETMKAESILSNGLTMTEFNGLINLVGEMAVAMKAIKKALLSQTSMEAVAAKKEMAEAIEGVEKAIETAIASEESAHFVSGFTVVNDKNNGYFDVEVDGSSAKYLVSKSK